MPKQAWSQFAGKILIALLPALWFFYHFVQNQWIYSKDTTDFFYVVKRWVWQHFSNGQIPLWNDQLFTGIYQMASPAIAVFTPNTALFYNLFSSFHAEQYQLPFFAAIAALGAYKLARDFISSRMACGFLGVAYGLSGPFLWGRMTQCHFFWSS